MGELVGYKKMNDDNCIAEKFAWKISSHTHTHKKNVCDNFSFLLFCDYYLICHTNLNLISLNLKTDIFTTFSNTNNTTVTIRL